MKTIALLLTLLTFGLTGCNFASEQEIIIAPRNFKGYIVVIFNQKDGAAIQYKDSKRVYEIPQDGILKTQFNVNDGWQELPEFYYEEVKSANKLPSFVQIEKVPSDTIVGFMGASGNANKDYEGKETVKYSLYYIGTKSEIEQAKEQVSRLDIAELSQ